MPESPVPSVFGYNAEATDYSTGLQYLRARYYDATVQRFVQEDDYRGSFAEPQTMNRYAYVGNNPTMRVDPSGYFYYMGNQQVSSNSYAPPKTATSIMKKVEEYAVEPDDTKPFSVPDLPFKSNIPPLSEYANKNGGETDKPYFAAPLITDPNYFCLEPMYDDEGMMIEVDWSWLIDFYNETNEAIINTQLMKMDQEMELIVKTVKGAIESSHTIDMQHSGQAMFVSNYYSQLFEATSIERDYRTGEYGIDEYVEKMYISFDDFRNDNEHVWNTYIQIGKYEKPDVLMYSTSGGFEEFSKLMKIEDATVSVIIGEDLVMNFKEQWAAQYINFGLEANYNCKLPSIPLNYSTMISNVTGENADNPYKFEGVTIYGSIAAFLQANIGGIPGTDIQIAGLGIGTNSGLSISGTYSDMIYKKEMDYLDGE